ASSISPTTRRPRHLGRARLVAAELALAQMALGRVWRYVGRLLLPPATASVDAAYVPMRGLGDRARFLLEALLALFVGHRLRRHHLDGDLAVERYLHTQINIGHAAPADPAQHAITGQLRHVAAQQCREFVRCKLFGGHGGNWTE